MKLTGVFLAAVSLVLAGCGVDSMSAAATAAATKKQEVEQGKKNMEQAQQNINQALDLSKQATDRAAEADK